MYGLECERCKERIAYGVAMRLIGGIHTVLCPLCQTEWDSYAIELDMFRELSRLEAVRASIIYARELSVDDVDPALLRVRNEILTCRRSLHQEGLQWLGRES